MFYNVVMNIEYDPDLKITDFNYNSYLKIDELFSLQQLVSDPPHHDEMFFIIIHQASELWFKLIDFETHLLVKSFRDGSISRSLKVLKRLNQVMDLMCKQINLLSTLTPVEFAGFRNKINPASGFQSSSFRKMEFVYGLREEYFLKFFEKMMPEVVEELKDLAKKPSVYDEFLKALDDAGFKIPQNILNRDVTQNRQVSDKGLVSSFKNIYENSGDQYHWVLICEALLDFDEKFSLFRQIHVAVVERCIGRKPGTGGSSGVEFLQKRTVLRLFPELWSVRTVIGK